MKNSGIEWIGKIPDECGTGKAVDCQDQDREIQKQKHKYNKQSL